MDRTQAEGLEVLPKLAVFLTVALPTYSLATVFAAVRTKPGRCKKTISDFEVPSKRKLIRTWLILCLKRNQAVNG